MKVSIIIPVYNAEKYLNKCIDSLLAQTLDDYELIFINDGSNDSSEYILDEYKTKWPDKLKYVTVDNGGQGRARNIGVGMAKGEYIGFADSDDWVDISMYEKMYKVAVENDADIVVCDCLECYDDGTTRYNKMTDYQDVMHINTAVWNKLFKRQLVQTVFFPEQLWYEDLAYVINAVIKAQKIVSVDEALYFYRIGQLSTMNNNNSRKNLDMIKIVDGLSHTMLPEHKDGFESILLNHVLLDTVNRVALQDSPDKDKVIKEILNYTKKYISSLNCCQAFKAESKNRQIIMWLNYKGLYKISQFIFKLKTIL